MYVRECLSDYLSALDIFTEGSTFTKNQCHRVLQYWHPIKEACSSSLSY